MMMRPRGAILLCSALVLLAASRTTHGQPVRAPSLVVDAPDRLAGVAAQARSFDLDQLASVMTLTGLREPGPPIQVVLSPEDSTIASETPAWVAGFAVSAQNLVVLFPERIGSYPHGSLESVLYHEVAHVLTGRAAKGAPVPRWFNEGLASAAERTWGLEDSTRFAWELLFGGPLTATELESLFTQERHEVARAYVLSDALVRDILERYGAGTAARILDRMGNGESFDLALFSTTGSTVEDVFAGFWGRHAVWERWIAFLGNPFTLWSFVTWLALVAIWRHRRRRQERQVQWENEERAEDQAWEEHRHKYRLH